jgi:hypothetical protein
MLEILRLMKLMWANTVCFEWVGGGCRRRTPPLSPPDVSVYVMCMGTWVFSWCAWGTCPGHAHGAPSVRVGRRVQQGQC